MKKFFSVSLLVLVMLTMMGVPVFAASVSIPLTTYFARVQVNPVYQLVN